MTLGRLVCAAIAAAVIYATPAVSQEAQLAEVFDFADIDGWADDDHAAALEVFSQTCNLMDGPEWPQLCEISKSAPSARMFFELFFRPVLIDDGAKPLFTGYFEPELDGSRYRTGRFRYPLYRRPPELKVGEAFLPRSEISSGALAGRGLEIAWVDDPVELFFLQIQGSGRIRMNDGSVMRVGYAAHNGHNYRSIGQELVRRGVYNRHQVSADVIKNWVRRNPSDGAALLDSNPSYVFFREVKDHAAKLGPIGAMNRPITAMRSIAVDPAFVPLGAPVWVDKGGETPLRRLMVAQDTGSAIKGAQRADIFYGTGDAAGAQAGRIKDDGRMLVLMPIQLAYGLEERLSG
ncbi:murein transglycosylase A [Celeribacter sp.]|uniref:murein transglycosylase A n=1 Tax=Celeribacter sp. TaxID=1890673 RepID=UPI003A91B2FF